VWRQALDVKLAEQPPPSAPRTAVKIDPRLLDSYSGRYSNAEREITATREGEQLFVQVNRLRLDTHLGGGGGGGVPTPSATSSRPSSRHPYTFGRR